MSSVFIDFLPYDLLCSAMFCVMEMHRQKNGTEL